MQGALLDKLPLHTHVFPNALDVFEDSDHAAAVFRADSLSFEEKAEALTSQTCLPRSSHAYCLQHDQFCPLYTGASSRVGGVPCQDWSRAGSQAGFAGKQLPCLFGYAARSHVGKNPVVALECVPQLPVFAVKMTFGSDYEWPLCRVVAPEMVGFQCIRRDRPLSQFKLNEDSRQINLLVPDPARLYMGARCASLAEEMSCSDALLSYLHSLLQREPLLRPAAAFFSSNQ